MATAKILEPQSKTIKITKNPRVQGKFLYNERTRTTNWITKFRHIVASFISLYAEYMWPCTQQIEEESTSRVSDPEEIYLEGH